jgi:hypothetical protein
MRCLKKAGLGVLPAVPLLLLGGLLSRRKLVRLDWLEEVMLVGLARDCRVACRLAGSGLVQQHQQWRLRRLLRL